MRREDERKCKRGDKRADKREHKRAYEREDGREIGRILSRNRGPDVEIGRVAQLKGELRAQAERMDFLPQASLPDRLARQIPYIAPWVWVVQAGVVLLFALLLGEAREVLERFLFLSFTGPLLALLPAVDLVRSFGCNMWEMEAACRYDLRQITAMRMCVVGGVDAAVLAFGGCLSQSRQGSVWEFGLFVLLPFLLGSGVYLWELNRFRGRGAGFVLCATGVGLNAAAVPVLQSLFHGIRTAHPGREAAFTALLLGLAAVPAIGGTVLLYSGLRERGESGRWSLE